MLQMQHYRYMFLDLWDFDLLKNKKKRLIDGTLTAIIYNKVSVVQFVQLRSENLSFGYKGIKTN